MGYGRAGVIALAAGLSAALALCGCTARGPAPGGGVPGADAGATGNGNVDTGEALGARPAPDFTLVNQFGQQMSLSQFRGKVVLLSFDDAVCTTVCPLTTQEVLLAKRLLGTAADDARLLGVDANPGATSTADVMAYSRAHAMVNQWDFLAGTRAQLATVWKEYGIYAQVEQGLVDHTPALFLIDQRGREQRIYLTAMAYSSISQQAQILAQQISRLLPGHPALSRHVPLSTITGLAPRQTVTMSSAASVGTVRLVAGQPHLVVFFATWLSETSNLAAALTGLDSYARAARHDHLPQLTALDEEVTDSVGSESWWQAVTDTRIANSDHMAEEEREALADFRRHASLQVRHDLAVEFAAYEATHASGIPLADEDPDRYLRDHESRR